MKDIMGLMSKAKEMQEKMQVMQEELMTLEVQGSSGGDMVKVTLNGKGQMKGISIDPALMKEDEAEILEDL
ncbi:MAG: YbaB/EbfC family nucleoid-associated protein, partial [Pseudomonadota bacterium]